MTPPTGKDLAPSGWRRFIDKLAGGPPNLEKLETLKGKRWFVRYNLSLFMLGAFTAIIFAPEAVTHLNGVPDPAALQTLNVRILQTYLVEPHLLVELADGRQRGMEWPVPISGGRGGFRSSAWSDSERLLLKGCQATVRGALLRWTVEERFRVWELKCPEKAIDIGMDKTADGFRSWESARAITAVIIYPGIVLLLVFIFLREKRGNI